MALVNQAKREINAKILFYGPGLSGKASNLRHIFSKLKPEFRGAMKAMNVQDGRMLFFDFTPPGDGNVEGFRLRFHVYTVSGEAVDAAAWRMVLKGVDGIVFVADSAPGRQAANREALDNLQGYLKGYGQSLSSIPVVFQYNKNDLADALDPGELNRTLNRTGLPSFKASSLTGEGVLQCTLALAKTVLAGLRDKGLGGIGSGEELQRVVEPPAAPAPRMEREEGAPAPSGFRLASGAEGGAVQAQQLQSLAQQAQGLAQQALAQQTLTEPGPWLQPAQQAERPQPQQAEQQPAQQAGGGQPQQAAEELSLEIAGVPQMAAPGVFRLPLTVRSGARTKTVVLSLALSLEEE